MNIKKPCMAKFPLCCINIIKVSLHTNLKLSHKTKNYSMHLSLETKFHSWCRNGTSFKFLHLKVMPIGYVTMKSKHILSAKISLYINMVHLHFALNSKMRDKICAMGLTIPASSTCRASSNCC